MSARSHPAWARVVACAAGLGLSVASCRAPSAPHQPARPESPYALVLGTAQDGGIPHIGCDQPACRAARADVARARAVTSLAVCDPSSGARWLIDCTPDLPRQLERLRGHPMRRGAAGDATSAGLQRQPAQPFEGIFLTHAHMGHVSGLLWLGREALGVRGQVLFGSERMLGFLSANDPYRTWCASGAFLPRAIEPGSALDLAPDLAIEAFRVPHRDEWSDTLGFVVRGPRRSLAYLPDIDKWERWDERDAGAGPVGAVERLIASVDFALLDGCFFADGEIPGRSMADIPHPFISASIARFARLPPQERAKVFFTHLNHTNPAAVRGSPAWQAVRDAGMHVLEDGQRFDL